MATTDATPQWQGRWPLLHCLVPRLTIIGVPIPTLPVPILPVSRNRWTASAAVPTPPQSRGKLPLTLPEMTGYAIPLVLILPLVNFPIIIPWLPVTISLSLDPI